MEIYPKINDQYYSHVIYEDSNKDIWVGSWGYGLFKLQKRNIDIADRIGLIAWFAVIAILFMTEPVLYYGRTNLMAFFFFMAGIVEFSGALAYKEEHLSDAR